MDEDDNIFDDDDALECIILQDLEKPDARGGCLSLVLLLIVPVGVISLLLSHF